MTTIEKSVGVRAPARARAGCVLGGSPHGGVVTFDRPDERPTRTTGGQHMA
ncbi:hypothetical protein [Umezawaea sp. Da 62-37]|uniref:hypothetical protein n=1 Tax=Umezawaea sp. Da 62-37 TaxID=3075927 RepID=UPI0028F6FA45|nr:hypothetical protein [Umezawaea sp. Da 62-37]WNV89375.1 hypothetical protein RM788_14040 [Umezawaea sp. Da 62-37]